MEAISSTEEAGLPLKLVLAARARPITAKSSNRAFVTDTLPSLNCHPLPTASFQRRGSLSHKLSVLHAPALCTIQKFLFPTSNLTIQGQQGLVT